MGSLSTCHVTLAGLVGLVQSNYMIWTTGVIPSHCSHAWHDIL